MVVAPDTSAAICATVPVAVHEMPSEPLNVEVTNGRVFVMVTSPVAPETEMPAPAAVEDTKLLPNEFCFAANIVKSVGERKPGTDAVDVT